MIKLDFFLHKRIFAATMKNALRTAMLALVLLCDTARAQETLPQDRSSAVIFAYHRVGEDAFPGESIRLEQFAAHIRELESGAYNIMPLPDIVAALKAGATLPDRTVAVTFDGGYKSVQTHALPLLLEKNIPFTLFVSADYLDRDSDEYIGWADLKKIMKNRLATVGLHPASYTHLADADEEETKRQVNNAISRTRKILKLSPALFAYPFGEYSLAFRNAVQAAGFEAAFGQQSGVAYAGGDVFALPRFPMTEAFGDVGRFQMAASALPLPAGDIQPKDPRLDTASPAIGFTVDEKLGESFKNIACYASGQADRPRLAFPGSSRVELRLETPFEDDKIRINCTLPGPPAEAGDPPRWRWFGMLMTLPGPVQRGGEFFADTATTGEE